MVFRQFWEGFQTRRKDFRQFWEGFGRVFRLPINPALDDAPPFGVGWTTQPHPLGGCVPRLRSWGWIPVQGPNLRSHPDADPVVLALSIGLQKCVSVDSFAADPPTSPSSRSGFGFSSDAIGQPSRPQPSPVRSQRAAHIGGWVRRR